MIKQFCLVGLFFTLIAKDSFAQPNEDKVGAWYMYFWNTRLKSSHWGFQGDIQYRNWNAIGDLEQLLLRGGLTYSPDNTLAKFTLGYGHVTTGAYGDDDATTMESRIYQEALIPDNLGGRFHLTHRFRYEQRFVEGQDFRSRFRYNIFLNIALKGTDLKSKVPYIAFYNEIFINGERNIGNNNTVEIFDRNRTYLGLGYVISTKLKCQIGAMHQITNGWEKTQAQVSLHHKF